MKASRLFLLSLLLTFAGALRMSAQEAYCALGKTTKSNGDLQSLTVTFFYDNEKSNRGETIDVPDNGGRILNIPQEIPLPDYINIFFDSSFANYCPTSTYSWFFWLQAKERVSFSGWENLNTSEVENMSSMFYALGHYEDGDDWQTCKVENLDLTHFDTSKVTDMRSMFNNVYLDDALDISSFIINPGTQTDAMMAGSYFTSISLPATANNLAEDAFYYTTGIGNNPITLSYPEGVNTATYYANGESKGDEIEIKAIRLKEGDAVAANIVNGEGYAGSSCYKVSSYKEANYDWDTGFFVYTPNHYWQEGDRYIFKMKVRAATPTLVDLQSHNAPGFYIFYNMLGMSDFQVTTEWQEISYEGIITANEAGSEGMRTIAFMLNKEVDGQRIDNDFFFDDISWVPFSTNENGDDCFNWKGGYFLLPPRPEAYSVLSSDKTTLTFYYDDGRKSHESEGTVFRMTSGDSKQWYDDGYADGITQVELTPSFVNSGFVDNLTDNYFAGIGMYTPCLLYYPAGYTLQDTTEEDGQLRWKFGWFNKETPSAYAVLSGDQKTLTFYCDEKKSTHAKNGNGVMVYNLNTLNGGVAINSSNPEWIKVQDIKTSIREVVFDESFSHYHPITTSNWFYGLSNLISITRLDYLKTDQVIDFALMFDGCRSLTNIDVSNFDTHNAVSFTSMFNGCSSLKSIDVSNFDDSNIPTGYGMNSMFAYCESLESLDLSNFVFSGTNNAAMLRNCTNLKTLTVSPEVDKLPDTAFENVGTASSPCALFYTTDFSPSDITYYETYMEWKGGFFVDYYPYVQLDENREDGGVPDGLKLTFYCDNLYKKRPGTAYPLNAVGENPGWYNNLEVKRAYFDESFSKARPDNTYHWFALLGNLKSVMDIYHLNTSSVTNMSGMFALCPALEYLDLSQFDTSNVTDMSSMFNACLKLSNLYIDNFDTSNVKNMSGMFSNCRKLPSLDLSNFVLNDDVDTETMLYNCSGLRDLSIPTSYKKLDMDACEGVGSKENPCALIVPWLTNLTELKTDDHGSYFKWKAGYFTDTYPYAVLSNQLLLSFHYDNQSATRYGKVYALNYGDETPRWAINYDNIRQVQEVVFAPSFANARPKSTCSWFTNMINLETIQDIEYLNTEEVTNMALMFSGTFSLKNVDLSHFNTSKVTNMSLMFSSASNMESIDLSKFDTSNVESMALMFYQCTSLKTLDLSNFTLKENLSSPMMLWGCSSLQELTVPASANNTSEGSFIGVGSADNPCLLNYPTDITLEGSTPGDGYFQWKGGYFKDAPYALVSPDGKTLTFYNDNERSSRNGTKYALNKGNNYPDWIDEVDLTKVVFDSSFANARPTSCYAWFSGKPTLVDVEGLQYLNTSESTSLGYMFDCCYNIQNLDLSHLTIPENTVNIVYDCQKLKNLTLPATANNLYDGACNGVGTTEAPCRLGYPEGLTLEGKEDHGTYFIWKGGFFTDAILGDANGDGKVTVTDVMMAVNHSLGRTPAGFNLRSANVNGDKDENGDDKVNITDVMLILKMINN